ncbi:MAG: TetR/AcrR family transcriptional regulator [Pseudomonadales bacterium]|nr:TetR/AcrR family transcriptional regulator [Pseudomonadales bacterium]
MVSTPTRAYRGVSAEQRSEERRQRLLEAALELFSTQGYAKTPIETLCAAAKVTARHFYQLFPSREALLRALYDGMVENLRAAVLAAVSLPDVPRHEQISLAVQALVLHYLEDSRRARVGVLEVVGVSAEMEQRRRAVIHEIADIIEHYIQGLAKRGELPEHNYHLISVALVGGINELLAEWLTVAQPPSVTDLSNEIIYIFDALLRGASPAKFT